jgi:hypothetical protein
MCDAVSEIVDECCFLMQLNKQPVSRKRYQRVGARKQLYHDIQRNRSQQ